MRLLMGIIFMGFLAAQKIINAITKHSHKYPPPPPETPRILEQPISESNEDDSDEKTTEEWNFRTKRRPNKRTTKSPVIGNKKDEPEEDMKTESTHGERNSTEESKSVDSKQNATTENPNPESDESEDSTEYSKEENIITHSEFVDNVLVRPIKVYRVISVNSEDGPNDIFDYEVEYSEEEASENSGERETTSETNIPTEIEIKRNFSTVKYEEYFNVTTVTTTAGENITTPGFKNESEFRNETENRFKTRIVFLRGRIEDALQDVRKLREKMAVTLAELKPLEDKHMQFSQITFKEEFEKGQISLKSFDDFLRNVSSICRQLELNVTEIDSNNRSEIDAILNRIDELLSTMEEVRTRTERKVLNALETVNSALIKIASNENNVKNKLFSAASKIIDGLGKISKVFSKR